MDHDEDWIPLTDPDASGRELERVIRPAQLARLCRACWSRTSRPSSPPITQAVPGVATASGTIGMWLALRALGIGPGDEVVACSYGWHQTARDAILPFGCHPQFCRDRLLVRVHFAAPRSRPHRAQDQGHHRQHPQWPPGGLESPAPTGRVPGCGLAGGLHRGAIGSRYLGKPVGSFGDLSVFDFSQPGALRCGEGGMVLTDDPHLATELRYPCAHRLSDRTSVSIGSRGPLQGGQLLLHLPSTNAEAK